METKYDAAMNRIRFKYVPQKTQRQPTEADIENLERTLGYSLPPDYRTFLAKYGLSTGSGIVHFGNLDDPDEEESSVGVFFGVQPGDSRNLLNQRSACVEVLDFPAHMLPIADGPGGMFVIALAGPGVRRIFGSNIPDEPTDFELIAYDFDRFINSLKLVEDWEAGRA